LLLQFLEPCVQRDAAAQVFDADETPKQRNGETHPPSQLAQSFPELLHRGTLSDSVVCTNRYLTVVIPPTAHVRDQVSFVTRFSATAPESTIWSSHRSGGFRPQARDSNPATRRFRHFAPTVEIGFLSPMRFRPRILLLALTRLRFRAFESVSTQLVSLSKPIENLGPKALRNIWL